MNSKKSLQNGFSGDAKNISPPRVQEKLVLYFTSLRGVRRTYEDCCHVRHSLKATGVRVDERDVSMHSGFRDELKELLGGSIVGGLPKVFIGNKCIGGVAETSIASDFDTEIGMTLSISADLQSLFTWNTKQVFVFLAAEYRTPKNALNQ